MNPDEQQQNDPALAEPSQAGGPVVSLSPEASQAQPEAEAPEGAAGNLEPVRWQAPEYIQREKTQGWFLIFILVTIGLIAVAVFLIKSITFAILIPVMAAALFVYTRRPPRILDYTLSRHGLYINDQLFAFGEFKSFALVHGLDGYSIMLVPTKRFRPAVTINFPESVGEAIVDTLSARLPMREVEPDVVDRIIKKLRL